MSFLAIIFLGASAFDDAFERSVHAYNESNYSVSIRELEQLVDQGVVTPEVFYNLGNAHYRNGDLGRAIASYERALQLNPGMDDARENLTLSIGQTQGQMMAKPLPPEWERALLFWHESLRPRTSLGLALASWVFFWLVLGLREVKRMPYMRRAAVLSAVLVLAFAASWWVKTHPQPVAVAVSDRVPVHYGTSESEKVRFELFEGDRVRVEEAKGQWLRISTWDGERGWAQSQDFVYVGPPSQFQSAWPITGPAGEKRAG